MRNQGRLRLGYFPLPLTEARRIRACLRYPDFAGFDDRSMHRGWGSVPGNYRRNVCAPVRIELDAYRAEQAAAVVDEMVLLLIARFIVGDIVVIGVDQLPVGSGQGKA